MKRRKLNKQKLFCAISICFIVGCCIFYGGRFIKLYIENKKTESTESNNFTRLVKKENFGKENFVNISGSYYLKGNIDNNYVLYSNILWRIIRINEDDTIMLISNDSLLNLAYGEVKNYQDSYIYEYLNKTDEDYTGILENLLNEKEKYLTKTKTCIDKIDEASSKCNEYLSESYINLLSIYDYVNAGASESFINNDNNTYLASMNTSNKVWYINNSNKLALSDGTNFFGIRPVIYTKSDIDLVSGTGKIDDPYIIEKDNGLFGSYVKLGNDTYRVYDVNEDKVKLVLNDYLKVDGEALNYAYSNSKTYFNDTTYGTLAYYLNNTYLNSLAYKDLAQSCNYSNGYYGAENDFDYKEVLKTTIDSKITIQSVGNIILNNELSNYFLMTGTTKNGNLLYTLNSGSMYGKTSTSKINVVPTICINKDILTEGKGTNEVPYEVAE